MSKRRLLPILLAASLSRAAFGQTPAPPPGDTIAQARDLYAAARYDEALAVLNDLRPDDGSSDVRSVEQYRSLCLLALGRGPEAETAIAALVTADPMYLPSDTDASPRVRTAFSDVRHRLLPDIATSRYAEAKTAFDRKDYPSASAQFRQVMALLDDPDMGGRLTDLRTLSLGFLDLSVAALAPPPEPKKDPPPPPAPVVPPPPAPPRTYSVDDTNVVAPVVQRQEFPRVPQPITAQAHDHGVIEIVIDEKGRVVSATIRQSLHPIYDTMLLNAAREWKYDPATVDGKPVKYRKLIQVNLDRRHEVHP